MTSGTFAEPEAPDDRHGARRAVRLAAFAQIAIAGAGLIAVPTVRAIAYRTISLFFEQFARIEAPSLWLVVAVAVAVLVALRFPSHDSAELPEPPFRPIVIAGLSALVVVLVYCGTIYVFKRFLLTDDEYSAWFQAQIFSRGHAAAHIPAGWCAFSAAITPTSIMASDCTWRLGFLPLHSLFNAGFIAVGADRLGGPVAAGLSLILIASIARKAWPDRPARAYLAAIFFAASMQVLFMSMTFFSMSTHLLFSLAWLWLYVDDRRWSVLALPWVGVLALGVHSPFPHALFAAVFVLRYLWQRRFAVFVYASAVYFAGLAYWYRYLSGLAGGQAKSVAASVSTTVDIAAHSYTFPSAYTRLIWGMHLSLVPSWSCLIVVLLAIAAMLRWKHLDSFSRALAGSLLVVLIMRAFITQKPQGVGWGYRYMYDAIGSLVLLAALGAEQLAAACGRRRALQLIGASVAAAFLVQLPMRSRDVRSIIDPYRKGYEWMSALPYPVVVFPGDMVSWGRQLVRNDPDLRDRPVIMSAPDLGAQGIRAIGADSAGSRGIKLVTRSELRAHGFPLSDITFGSLIIAPR